MKIEITADHKYFIDKIPAVGVNEILRTFGIGLDIDSLCPTAKANFENARIRGHYLHTMSALHLQGRLNEESLDPQLFPYLVGLKKFLIDHKVEPIAIEEKIGFKTLLLCGTPDIKCKFDGTLEFLDFKFVAQLRKYYHLQLGGYAYIHNSCVKEPEDMIENSHIIHILPNDYKIEEVDKDAPDEFRELALSFHIIRKYSEACSNKNDWRDVWRM